jgi:hypothetical protein
MRRADRMQRQGCSRSHTLFLAGVLPCAVRHGRMNQDAGGDGLPEPSTDAPADTDLSSMPAGMCGRLHFQGVP